jgi:hypothetical protein
MQLELERVQRNTGGRIHLTPHVPDDGAVSTLCGQQFAAGSYHGTEEAADCRNCIRRKDDPARISSAFFQSEAGGELLQLSLARARERREERQSRPSPPVEERPAPPRPPPPRPEPPAPARMPEIRELRSAPAIRQTFENVYQSPAGVILRLARDGTLSEVAFNGPMDLRRRRDRITLRVGDVELELRND